MDFQHDPELDRGGAAMRHAVMIDAVLKDGCRLSTRVEQRRGSAERPLSRNEIETKFARTAAAVLPPSAIDELVELVEKIDRQADLSRLAALVTTAA
jgi:aconitate decarboxylase